MNFITCHVCQTQNPTDNRFCLQCNARLQGMTHIICSACYHRNVPSVVHCDNCGNDLTSSSQGKESEDNILSVKKRTGELAETEVLSEGELQVPDWFDDLENAEDISSFQSDDLTLSEPIEEEASELEDGIDWLNVLNLDALSTEQNAEAEREQPLLEVTDWVTQLEKEDDPFVDGEDTPPSVTEKLLLSDDPQDSNVSYLDIFGEGDPLRDFGELVKAEGQDNVSPVLPTAESDLTRYDRVQPGEIEESGEEGTGFTDWLVEVEEETEFYPSGTSADSADPVLDELPDWLVLGEYDDNDNEDPLASDQFFAGLKAPSEPEDVQAESEDKSISNPEGRGWLDDVSSEPEKKTPPSDLGITDWLDSLTVESEPLQQSAPPDWVDDSPAEALLQEVPAWLLDSPNTEPIDEGLANDDDDNVERTGFTDLISDRESAVDEDVDSSMEAEADDFAWLRIPDSFDLISDDDNDDVIADNTDDDEIWTPTDLDLDSADEEPEETSSMLPTSFTVADASDVESAGEFDVDWLFGSETADDELVDDVNDLDKLTEVEEALSETAIFGEHELELQEDDEHAIDAGSDAGDLDWLLGEEGDTADDGASDRLMVEEKENEEGDGIASDADPFDSLLTLDDAAISATFNEEMTAIEPEAAVAEEESDIGDLNWLLDEGEEPVGDDISDWLIIEEEEGSEISDDADALDALLVSDGAAVSDAEAAVFEPEPFGADEESDAGDLTWLLNEGEESADDDTSDWFMVEEEEGGGIDDDADALDALLILDDVAVSDEKTIGFELEAAAVEEESDVGDLSWLIKEEGDDTADDSETENDFGQELFALSGNTGFTDLLNEESLEDDDARILDENRFDDWLSGSEAIDEDSLDNDTEEVEDIEEIDDLSFLSDEPEPFESAGTGFTGWLKGTDQIDELLGSDDADDDSVADDADLEEPKRTGFTGWLADEPEEEPENDEPVSGEIPAWLKDSDELPTLEGSPPEEPVVLGEGAADGQSFSDWLKQSGVEIEEERPEADLLSESEPTGFTQWLTDPTADPLDLSVLEEGDDEWLENIIPVNDASSEEVVADMPDWLTETPHKETVSTDGLEAEVVPDWLRAPGTGELDSTVVDEIDELLESGAPEWIAELESGPLHTDQLEYLPPSDYARLVGEDEDSDESWLDGGEADGSLMSELLGDSGLDDDELDDSSWLASLNLSETDSEGGDDELADHEAGENDDEIVINEALPDWLLAAKPADADDSDDIDGEESHSTAEANHAILSEDIFANDESAEDEIDELFLAKLSALDGASEGELDLSDVELDWEQAPTPQSLSQQQDLSDQLAPAELPDWLGQSDGLTKADIPDWLQQPQEAISLGEDELFAEAAYNDVSYDETASSNGGVASLAKIVPIASAIERFITTELRLEQTIDLITAESVERQHKKAESWSKIVQHDVEATLTHAPKAPKVKPKRPPKATRDSHSSAAVGDRPRKRYRSLMLFLLIVLLGYFLWIYEPDLVLALWAQVQEFFPDIDFSAILARFQS